ncbi:ABC transporter ATP-binding protein [Alkalilimnicola ehrlichii MLHE-1]|uniref:ABC transporter related protein n=1 Tax=Alkalilimnicola ehrlichii (strain ATCC BAA-1101 / DSM 17681 / MLHE-1) TaxID=187272 RepID=Q0A7C2_ALKEH|nr:ABC transporter ATP-binding protein [Alkalilimnicola ehrlichii]ABI57265.1 ABC transporter related protein [Alkalilimnicola ehrlichii MLHE-1]
MSEQGLAIQVGQAAPIPLNAALDCAPGELLALVGPSGSGKTTLLRSIAGLYRPSSGRIDCNGVTWFDAGRGVSLAPQRRRVGVVFQDYALFPHLTALQNLVVAMGHRPRAQRRACAAALLAQVHLEGLEDRYPSELSGGQRQRVALARALARDPEVLLMDEPFSAVDQVTRRKLQRELALLRSDLSIPLVLVTHDLDEAVRLADRITVLHRGVTLQTAPPDELMLHPASADVARLVGHQNLFRGRVIASNAATGRLWLEWQGQTLEATYNPSFPPGSEVTWLAPASHVLLHRRGRPSLGERENPVAGVVRELVVLGEQTSVTLSLSGGAPLNFTVGTHAARRNGLAPGEEARVSLLADGIHLMAPEPDPQPATR